MTIDEMMRREIVDELAAEQRMLEAVEMQRKAEGVRERPDAHDIVIRIERILKDHIASLEKGLAVGAAGETGVKNAVKGVMGVLAGLFDRLRGQSLSEMMRSNFTALSHAEMSAEILRTLALAAGREDVARLSLKHAEDIASVRADIRRLIPAIVVSEAAGPGGGDAATELSVPAVTNAREA